MADRPTVDVYEHRAGEWEAQRSSGFNDAAAFASTLGDGDRPVLDLGCGPGWQLPAFGPSPIGLDAATAFIRRLPDHAPGALGVQADLEHLPLRSGSIGALWANRSLVHIPRGSMPMALWDAHRVLRVGAPMRLTVFAGDQEFAEFPGDTFAGRRFSLWQPDHLRDVVENAGFEDVTLTSAGDRLVVDACRGVRLADTVGADMRVLLVGLNPSILSAERGVGFVRAGNRFWPAALAAELVSRDRDPLHALDHHRVGMTNLVARPTRGADELRADEYRSGGSRLERLVRWLQPRVVCVVGVTGWRVAVDRKAAIGLQREPFGGRPVVVMHNPSGLNAHATVASLTNAFREVMSIADGEPPS